jgi:hypothetical protein
VRQFRVLNHERDLKDERGETLPPCRRRIETRRYSRAENTEPGLTSLRSEAKASGRARLDHKETRTHPASTRRVAKPPVEMLDHRAHRTPPSAATENTERQPGRAARAGSQKPADATTCNNLRATEETTPSTATE